MSPVSKSHFIEASKRYYKHLPPADDMTLLLLKGHLLIEELIHRLVEGKLAKPGALKTAKLETNDWICLAEALLHDQAPNWLWDALRKLNGIRNKLAHNLEPTGCRFPFTLSLLLFHDVTDSLSGPHVFQASEE